MAHRALERPQPLQVHTVQAGPLQAVLLELPGQLPHGRHGVAGHLHDRVEARIQVSGALLGPHAAVVDVDAHETGVDLERADHLDRRLDDGVRHAGGQVDGQVVGLGREVAERLGGPQRDAALRLAHRDRDERVDLRRPEVDRRAQRDVLQAAAVDVVVRAELARREHPRHARRRDDPVDHVEPGVRLDRRARVRTDEPPVLGDVVGPALLERGDRQAQLQAGSRDQRGVDRRDAHVGATTDGLLERTEVQRRPGQPVLEVASARQATGDLGDLLEGVAVSSTTAAAVAVRRVVAHGGQGLGLELVPVVVERRPPVLGHQPVDRGGGRGPVELRQPGLLGEDDVRARHRHQVALGLDQVAPALLGVAALPDHGAQDPARRGRGDDARHQAQVADQVLQRSQLERPLEATAGEHEADAFGGLLARGSGRHARECAPRVGDPRTAAPERRRRTVPAVSCRGGSGGCRRWSG